MANSQIKISPTAAKASGSGRRNEWFVVGVVLGAIAAVLVTMWVWEMDVPEDEAALPQAVSEVDVQPAVPAVSPTQSPRVAQHSGESNLLWVSPTSGPPLDLRYLPLGCALLIAVRPHEILDTDVGDQVLASLGPDGATALRRMEEATGLRSEEIEQLLMGCRVDRAGSWSTTYVVRTATSATIDHVTGKLAVTDVADVHGHLFHSGNKHVVYVPRGAPEPVMVVTSTSEFVALQELANQPPPLRRELEELAAASDADRHVTMLAAPHLLTARAKHQSSPPVERWQAALRHMIDDDLTALSLSMHWGDDFFVELRAAASIDARPDVICRRFQQQLADIPSALEAHVFQLDVQPYGRALLARLPAMVRALNRYTRHDTYAGHAVLRAYLPLPAGHNLLAAGELALVEPTRGTQPLPQLHATEQRATLDERLSRITSLSFGQETLAAALALLSAEIGVPIELDGTALRAEGITRNQSFALDLAGGTARDVLLEIVLLANPDRSATSPRDPRQKLVYVVDRRAQRILVTTRAAATSGGHPLPPAFGGP